MFLLAETPTHPMHVGAVQVFTPPPGSDASDVHVALGAALATADMAAPLRRKASRSLSSLGQWGWQQDTQFRVANHVHRHTLPHPAGRGELLELCSRLHSGMLDRGRPLWEMHLIDGLADGRYAVYTKMHHAVADGVAAMRMLHASLSADCDQRGMPAVGAATDPSGRPHTQPRAYPLATRLSRLSRLPRAVVSAGGAVSGAGGEAIGLFGALANTVNRARHEDATSLSLSAPHSMFNVPITAERQFTARSWPIHRLRQVAKSNQATINDVVLAMCSGALRSYLHDRDTLPDAPLVAMVPVSLRTANQPREAEQRGNQIGVLMCNLATHLEDPGARLAAVRDLMADGKQSLRNLSSTQILATSAVGVGSMALSLLPGYTRVLRTGIFRPPFNVVISNVPGPTGPQYWNGARLDEMYPLSIPTHGQALNITCTSTDDQVSFGLTGCPASVPDLHQLTDYLNEELAALEYSATAGWIPRTAVQHGLHDPSVIGSPTAPG